MASEEKFMDTKTVSTVGLPFFMINNINIEEQIEDGNSEGRFRAVDAGAIKARLMVIHANESCGDLPPIKYQDELASIQQYTTAVLPMPLTSSERVRSGQ